MDEQAVKSAWDTFIPFGQSYLWQPEILWTQIFSNSLIAISFFSIPFTFLYFFWNRRHELKLQSVYVLFAFFAFACGASYMMNVVVTWFPIYQYQAAVEFVAAVASVATSIFLWPRLPVFLNTPSNQDFEDKVHEIEFAEEKFNLVLDSSEIGVFEWQDLKSSRRPIFWSARMFELLGFKRNSFEPTLDFLLSLIHPDERQSVQSIFADFSKNEIRQSMSCRLRVKSEYKWFKLRIAAKTIGRRQVPFLIGTIEDIHAAKMGEKEIRAAQESLEAEIKKRTNQLQLANYAKNRFLANMTHEMRTPLGLLLGFSELLEENPSLNQDALAYVRLMRKNGEILARVINDLLDLSKIESGKLQFQYSKILLRQLIEEFEKNFETQARRKGIQISFQNLLSDSETMVSDEVRLKQIVYNLLSNAIKYTEHGSVHLTVAKREGFYAFDIIDTGIGIAEQDKTKIFNEYVRDEEAGSKNPYGVGLGLHLSQNLTRALGGHIELVSSQIGRGSHFRVIIPSDEKRLQKQMERRREATLNSKLKELEIFVLDDNEDNIRLAEIFLKKLGCRVRGFTSAKSLFAEMISSDPDLVLLDINMPEMSGFEVLDRLRRSGYKNPIWALTAYGLNEDIQAILDHGFDDFIRKPISIESMKRKLVFELREHRND